MKKWYLSRTVWLGIIVVAGGIAEYIAGLPPGVAISTVIAGALGVIVRFLTNTKVTK